MQVKKCVHDNVEIFKRRLGVGISFDVVLREFEIGHRQAAMFYINGMITTDAVVEFSKQLMITEADDLSVDLLEKILATRLNFPQVSRDNSLESLLVKAVSGPLILFVDGYEEALVIDARSYHVRSTGEPDIEKVSRGARDGFMEALLFNVNLLRRRVRDAGFRAEVVQVGKRSKTDVALVYIDDITNKQMIALVKQRLQAINIDGVSIAERTVEDYVSRRKWWNPLPVIRYTERPDVAANHLLEGHILIMVDNTPSVIIAPATLSSHLHHPEEYRQTVVTGTYFRWVRTMGILFSVLLPAFWLALVTTPGLLPDSLAWIGPTKLGKIPLPIEFLIAEVGIDLFRMATIHAPSALATALGFIGTFMLGDIAIKVGLFSAETVLYVAIATAGSFATPSLELGLAFRVFRIAILLLTICFKMPGYLIGVLLLGLILGTTKSFGVPYLWPMIPFNRAGFLDLLFRLPITHTHERPEILQTIDPDSSPKEKENTDIG